MLNWIVWNGTVSDIETVFFGCFWTAFLWCTIHMESEVSILQKKRRMKREEFVKKNIQSFKQFNSGQTMKQTIFLNVRLPTFKMKSWQFSKL